jgi:hypothetical protein
LKFAEVSSKLLATPLPILLKIKNGMLCIPSSYSISQGNARALGESFAALDTFLDKEKKEIEMLERLYEIQQEKMIDKFYGDDEDEGDSNAEQLIINKLVRMGLNLE